MSSDVVDDALFRQQYRFSDDGDALKIEIWTEPGGGVLAEHLHPSLEERYEVLDGEVTFQLDGTPLRGEAGTRVVVPAGTRHSFQNTGRGPSRVVVEARPPGRLRESIEDGAALSRTQRFTSNGTPRTLRALVEAAALAHRYEDTVVLCSPPRLVQRTLFPLLARFASSTGGAGA